MFARYLIAFIILQISVKTLLYLAYDLHQLSHTSHGEIWACTGMIS